MIIGHHRINAHLTEEDADIIQHALMYWKGPYREGEKLTQEEKDRVGTMIDKAQKLAHILQVELIQRNKYP